MPTIKDALDIIGKLTVAEQESLKTMLLSPAFVKSLNIEDFVAKERFANGRVCPLCGCIHVVRNGHRKDGTQRYVCKDCGKSFVIATNSIVSGTRKDLSVWEQYIKWGRQITNRRRVNISRLVERPRGSFAYGKTGTMAL